MLADLRLLIKTEKYIKRKQSASTSAIEGQILQTRGAQNIDREKQLVARVRSSVSKSTLVINAADITSNSQEAVARLTDGFQDLISRTYTQLKLLGGVIYSEQQIASAVNPDGGLFDVGTSSKLFAPAEEVLSFVLRKDALGEQVSVKNVVDSFTAKPYGWDLASIEVLIAFLVGTSKVTLTVDGNVLKRSEVATALRNTQRHSHSVVAAQKAFDERAVAGFRKFCADFFDEANVPKDPLELARQGADKLKSKRDELRAVVAGSKYPFVAQLTSAIDLLDGVVGKPVDWYLTDFHVGDDLLDAKESVIDPIQAFLNGGQRVIYDEAADLLAVHSSNLGYLPSGSETTVQAALADPNAFRGNRMTQLKQATDQLRAQIDEKVAENRAAVVQEIAGRKAEIEGSVIYAKASSAAQGDVLQLVDRAITRVRAEKQIALIREFGASFEESTYPSMLDLLAESQQVGDCGGDESPPKRTVSIRTISATGIAGVLETEKDVDRYLAALRSALVQNLNDGKRISL